MRRTKSSKFLFSAISFVSAIKLKANEVIELICFHSQHLNYAKINTIDSFRFNNKMQEVNRFSHIKHYGTPGKVQSQQISLSSWAKDQFSLFH